jgi:hypothetical protein
MRDEGKRMKGRELRNKSKETRTKSQEPRVKACSESRGVKDDFDI